MNHHRLRFIVSRILLLAVCILVSSCSSRPRLGQAPGAVEGTSGALGRSAPDESASPGQTAVSSSVSESSSSDPMTVWIERGKSILFSTILARLKEDFFTPAWNFDSEIARLDEDRFPDWARGRYDVCVYWELPMQEEVIRMQRNPGESRWVEISGKCWGWILLGGDEEEDPDYHILELAYEWPPANDDTEGFQDYRGVTKHIDDWGPY